MYPPAHQRSLTLCWTVSPRAIVITRPHVGHSPFHRLGLCGLTVVPRAASSRPSGGGVSVVHRRRAAAAPGCH